MLGALIGAGASLIGGLLNKKADQKARDEAYARDDTQIQRRVADARAAGISPLFALGAPTSSTAPVSVGMGDAISNMGQDIGRAVDSGRSSSQKVDSYTAKLQALQLERGSLENTLLRHQILSENRKVAGHPPTLPSGRYVIAGQGDSRSPENNSGQSANLPGFGGPVNIRLPKGVSTAADATDVIGEAADIPYGIYAAMQYLDKVVPGARAYYNTTKKEWNAISKYVQRKPARASMPSQGYRARHLVGRR